MKKEKKEMEYEEAPSGYVTLYNYKEPFMEYRGGYGYLGVLLFDGESDKVQCHLCGEWHVALGNHLHREHAMRAIEYKEEVGLNKTTALIGEKMREKLIASGQSRFKNLKNRKGVSVSEETKQKIRNTIKENRLESKNLNGTCPAQLIDRLKKLYIKYGRTPRDREIPFINALKLTYGSLEEACNIAGIEYRKPGTNIENSRWIKEEDIVRYFSAFLKENRRFPKRIDCEKDGVKSLWDNMVRNKLGIKNIKAKAVLMSGSYQNFSGERIKHGKEGIIEMMRIFKNTHNRYPSVSDAKRRLIAPASSYYYYFKSFKDALKYAFPEYK